MSEVHDRETPLPPEPDTRPEVPQLTCPECRGEGYVLHVEEWETRHKARSSPCSICFGQRIVTRQVFAQWRAVREGRPSSTTLAPKE